MLLRREAPSLQEAPEGGLWGTPLLVSSQQDGGNDSGAACLDHPHPPQLVKFPERKRTIFQTR